MSKNLGLRIRIALPFAAASLLLAACGASSSSVDSAGTTDSTSTTVSAADSAGANPNATKPTITVPTTPAPTTLQTTDLVVGTGKTAQTGDTVSVQYVGANYADGKQFDASWDRGQPFSFQLGAGMVIKGWDEGVVGMKVGGRRELIIPASLGYGPDGQPPTIQPNETLIFVVDLESVSS